MVYNKLVRDKIPELIQKQGDHPVIRILDDEEFADRLLEKLDEEVAEYHADRSVDELADILEVVFALADHMGVNKQELIDVYQKKHDERGGFQERIYLISKTDKCI